MVQTEHCHKCDEVNSMKLIHTEYRSDKVGFTISNHIMQKNDFVENMVENDWTIHNLFQYLIH
jgi:hypothetical protein